MKRTKKTWTNWKKSTKNWKRWEIFQSNALTSRHEASWWICFSSFEYRPDNRKTHLTYIISMRPIILEIIYCFEPSLFILQIYDSLNSESKNDKAELLKLGVAAKVKLFISTCYIHFATSILQFFENYWANLFSGFPTWYPTLREIG